MKFVFLALILFLTACAGIPDDKAQPLVLKPASFSALPGWRGEDFSGVAQAFGRSCERMARRDPDKAFGPGEQWGTYGDWHAACHLFQNLNQNNAKAYRTFFETYFHPYEVRAGSKQDGLFTGYYEASLKGSRTKHGSYQYPLRARPDDLVMVSLGDFRDDLKGRRIAGRVVGGRLKPYEDHADILAGRLPAAQDKTLVWVDNPVDAFFVQIQGSGVVALDDGSVMRVGYAGQNGHPYYAIGRELVHRGALEKENVSLQSIRAWLKDNPNQAQEVMTTNPSYVFFQDLKSEGPKGGEGIALTPLRSLAVDHSIIPYGLPVWLQAEHPNGRDDLRRLMIAQDTGGAIRGPVRGDVFWGYGAEAEHWSGLMKSQGRYWFLLPHSVNQ